MNEAVNKPIYKPILCLDFDGVCHAYTSGWKGADVIPDEYVPGLFEFLESVKDDFDVQVLSSRSHQPGGREAMLAWFVVQRKLWRSRGGMHTVDTPMTIGFPTEKPPAVITLDDRGWRFDGVWPTLEALKSFKPWYMRGDKEASVADIAKIEAMPIRVKFGTARILPDGEIGNALVTQNNNELVLTREQSVSLGKQLLSRFAPETLK